MPSLALRALQAPSLVAGMPVVRDGPWGVAIRAPLRQFTMQKRRT